MVHPFNKIMPVECINCGFYIATNEQICPDCGLSAPTAVLDYKTDADSDQPLSVQTILLITALVVVGVGIFQYSPPTTNFSEVTWIIIGAAVLLSFFFAWVILPFITRHYSKAEKQKRFATADTPTNLQFIQGTILLRNHELKTRLSDFGTAMKKGVSRRAAFGKSRTPLEKIEVRNLSACYDLLNNRIDFARLQNQLKAVVEPRNSAFNNEERREWIGGIAADLELMSSDLTDDFASRVSANIEDEKQRLLAEIMETQKFCEALSKKGNEIQSFPADSEQLFAEDFTNRIKNSDARRMLANLAEAFAAAERRFPKLKINRQ